MKSSARIEIIDRRTVISAPFKLPAAFVPHVVMIGVILLASAIDMLVVVAGWAGL